MVPLLCRIYPNGLADVNHFHAAGGMSFLIGQLLDAGLLHPDVRTVAGEGGLERYREEPFLDGERLVWRPRCGRDPGRARAGADRPSRSAPRAGSSCSRAISAGR